MSAVIDGIKCSVNNSSVISSTSMTSPLASHPSSPTHSDSSGANMPPTSPPGNFRGVAKECGVCGDVAKSMHFGGLSCDSCKAFFRRSVQNEAYKGFSCPYDKKCVIDVSSRKACQFCRFGKCISIGMEKSWVMSEDERRKMMEQRKERKQEINQREVAQRQSDSAKYALSEEDRKEISSIVNLYKTANTVVPYDEVGQSYEGGRELGGGGGAEKAEETSGNFVLQPWMTFCKRIAYFFSLFKDFADLSSNDQTLLLKTAITSAGIIMGSVVYDSANGKWAGKINRSRVKNMPNISNTNVEKLVPSDLRTRVDTFFRKFQNICPDETMAMILILVSLYSPELMGLEARDRVQNLQSRYTHILQNYIKFKFKDKSKVMFPKAIVSLVDIRELADRTGQMRIKERAAGMLTGLVSSSAGAGMGSPFSGLSLSRPTFPPPTGYEVVPQSGIRDDRCLRNVVELVQKIQAIFIGSPTPLPAIVQLLRNYAMNCSYDSKSGKPLLSPKRAHRGSKSKSGRGSYHRPRKFKRESSYKEFPVAIKEEVMDHSDDTLCFGPESIQSTNLANSALPSQQLIESYPQTQQQSFQPSNFSQQQRYSAMCDSLSEFPDQSSDTFMVASQYSFEKDELPVAYARAASPDEEIHPIHHPIIHSPQQTPFIEVTESPPVQRVSSFSPVQQITSTTGSPGLYKADLCYSPLAPTPSPQSSSSVSSSSSSPEEDACQTHRSEVIQGLSKSESDMFANIIHQVMGVDIDDYAFESSLSASLDVLPPDVIQVIQDINSKFSSLGASTSVTASTHNAIVPQNAPMGPFSNLSSPVPTNHCSEREVIHLRSQTFPMEYQYMPLNTGIMMGDPHCMEVGIDSMEVETVTSLNNGI